jgi:hypothetical protein
MAGAKGASDQFQSFGKLSGKGFQTPLTFE